MQIAVTYDNGNVFQHFGHTRQFKLFTVDCGAVTASQIIDANGQGHGALAAFLSANEVDVLICGGIGEGAKNALAQAGIQLFGGVTGSADAAVGCYLAGTLDFMPDIACSHHHSENHSCHSHGNHSCGSCSHNS